MQEVTSAERRVMLGAAVLGLALAAALAYAVAAREGVAIGLAVFFLSWTFVALFVLLARYLFSRLVAPASPPPPVPGPDAQIRSSSGRRLRRRRRATRRR